MYYYNHKILKGQKDDLERQMNELGNLGYSVKMDTWQYHGANEFSCVMCMSRGITRTPEEQKADNMPFPLTNSISKGLDV